MRDVMNRVQKLLAMSTSPVEEEARTAAHMACKLIIEHGLLKPAQSTAADNTRPRRFPSGYSGVCKHCGEPYAAGEYILWKRGHGTTHELRTEYWENT